MEHITYGNADIVAILLPFYAMEMFTSANHVMIAIQTPRPFLALGGHVVHFPNQRDKPLIPMDHHVNVNSCIIVLGVNLLLPETPLLKMKVPGLETSSSILVAKKVPEDGARFWIGGGNPRCGKWKTWN
mmetsp:Transcript_11765/g.20031  ORF Transcript_11765/g.20031 Transcript_11765/m.20031 type:complete len:129 (-) Transcript_11765:495-881(-)